MARLYNVKLKNPVSLLAGFFVFLRSENRNIRLYKIQIMRTKNIVAALLLAAATLFTVGERSHPF